MNIENWINLFDASSWQTQVTFHWLFQNVLLLKFLGLLISNTTNATCKYSFVKVILYNLLYRVKLNNWVTPDNMVLAQRTFVLPFLWVNSRLVILEMKYYFMKELYLFSGHSSKPLMPLIWIFFSWYLLLGKCWKFLSLPYTS